MGRKKIDLDWNTLDGILQFKATIADCSEILGVSEDTIERRINENFGIKFAEYRNRKMAKMRLSLAQKAIAMAKSGNVAMMIFCLKNLCGWSDKSEKELEANTKFTLNYSTNE